MRLFLQWTLINVVFFIGLILIAGAYHEDLHEAAKVSIAIIAAIFLAANFYCGKVIYLLEKEGGEAALDRARRASFHVHFAAGACPMVGLLGTASGFLIAFGKAETQNELSNLIAGASTSLASTFVAIICCLILSLERHMLRSYINELR